MRVPKRRVGAANAYTGTLQNLNFAAQAWTYGKLYLKICNLRFDLVRNRIHSCFDAIIIENVIQE